MTTAQLRQDAARLLEMANELCAITNRVGQFVQQLKRGHMPYDVHSFVGGGVHGLRASARMLEELARELDQ